MEERWPEVHRRRRRVGVGESDRITWWNDSADRSGERTNLLGRVRLSWPLCGDHEGESNDREHDDVPWSRCGS